MRRIYALAFESLCGPGWEKGCSVTSTNDLIREIWINDFLMSQLNSAVIYSQSSFLGLKYYKKDMKFIIPISLLILRFISFIICTEIIILLAMVNK